MKIAIDLTSFGATYKGGKEQVICNILEGIAAVEPETVLVLFCYEDFAPKARSLAPGALIITYKRWRRFGFARSFLLRTFFFQKHIKDADVLFFPMYYTGLSRFSIPTVVLPHDVQFRSRPDNFDLKTRIKDRIFYWLDFRLRDHIIAISEFDRKEIIKYYPYFADKVECISNPIKACPLERKSARSHILAVNIGFRHKNADTIIRAYSLVRDRIGMPLLMVGNLYDPIEIEDLIASLELGDSVKLLGYVENDELSELMVDAFAYVTASEYEGFGMPSVEALINKVPVVSSTQEALREVTFESAFYFSPSTDSDALADCLLALKDNYPDAGYLEDMKHKAVHNFDYLRITEKYLEFFNRIRCRVIFNDPMSYNNLAIYDRNLLNRFNRSEVLYAANRKLTKNPGCRTSRIYGYSDINNPILKGASYLISQLKLLGLAKSFKAGIIHLQWSRMPVLDSMVFTYLKKFRGIRFIYTSHDTFTHNMENRRKKAYLRLMKAADEIIVHTSKAQKEIETYGFSNVSFINHGLLKLSDAYPSCSLEFEKGNRIVFSSPGYMEGYKGTDILLKAWLSSEFLLSEAGIHLVVAGVNRLGFKPETEGTNISFLEGKLGDDEFTAWMETSDVIVMPYQRISQSGLLLSALAMGKNVIVNDVGEMAEPVRRFGIGWVTDAYDSDALRKQLEEIVREILKKGLKPFDDDKMRALDEYYSWDEAASLTEDIYRRIIRD